MDVREAVTGSVGALSATGALLASASDGDVAGWIERVGFPVAVCCAIGLAALRLARWVGARVVEPIVSKHVAFVDAVSESTRAQAETSRRTLEVVERMEQAEASREEAAAKDREAAAEDRRTSRLAVDGVREAIDRLGRAMDAA